MKMNEFEITIMSPYRIVIGFVLLAIIPLMITVNYVASIATIYIIGVWSLLSVFIAYVNLYILSFGKLKVKQKGALLEFEWIKKVPFSKAKNWKIDINKIEKIRLDYAAISTALVIYTKDCKISLANIENVDFFQDDMKYFIHLLETAHLQGLRGKKVVKVDSWKEFSNSSKGNIFATIYLIIAIISSLIVMTAIYQSGFKIKYIAWFIMGILPFIIWWQRYQKSKGK